jgi:hypothetical protein
MVSIRNRAAIYLRVSTTDRQTRENQRIAFTRIAEHRGWSIVLTYEGPEKTDGISARPRSDAQRCVRRRSWWGSGVAPRSGLSGRWPARSLRQPQTCPVASRIK